MNHVFHILCAGVLILGANLSAAETTNRPNVLLIICDDLNCRLGCYGAPEAKTPNIDRLAARGVRFERAYCNYPVCNASRTSFLSGLYPEVTGVVSNTIDPRIRLGPDFQFLPEYFRAQGYFTAGCGKVAHGNFSEGLKWDTFSKPDRSGEGDEGEGGKKMKRGKKKGDAAGSRLPFDWQATNNADADEPDGQTARRLIPLLSEKRDRPFFITAGFHKPHVPHTAPQKYFDLHDPARMPTPPEPPSHEDDIPIIARAQQYDDSLTLEQRRAIIQHYYAATSFVDTQVGVLLDEMDRLRLWDTTVVVFMSDHGWHLGEHGGFYAKMSLMDESARAPLIVAAPGVQAGVAARALVEYVDVFPTLADFSGIPPPAGLQGASFVPVLRDHTLSGKDSVYTIVMRGGSQIGRALHTQAFTYLEWPDGSQQLYNAATDPREYVNLAKDANHTGTPAEMKQALAKRRADLGLENSAPVRRKP